LHTIQFALVSDPQLRLFSAITWCEVDDNETSTDLWRLDLMFLPLRVGSLPTRYAAHAHGLARGCVTRKPSALADA